MITARRLCGEILRTGFVVLALGVMLAAMSSSAPAQEKEAAAAPVTGAFPAPAAPPGGMPPGAHPMPPGRPGEPGRPDKPGENKDKPGDQKDKPDDKNKKDEEPKVVERPTEPPAKPNPDELKVRPDKDGRVKFNFVGQPWPEVLQWLADISGMSLDWQEAPAGFLNLTTSRPYTVEETRDLVNRLLLNRGFTLLVRDGVLSLVNIKKLDPSVVPRVAPEELADRRPHEFVKVSFTLERLLAESAVEELKPMLSPNGKLTALTETNRLEAIDAVVNLREIHALLGAEQAKDVRGRPPRVFKLQYRRAEEMIKQLQTLLGVEAKSSRGPMSPQEMQQAQQQAQMMAQQQQQQQQQQGGKPPGGKPAGKPEVYLVADDHNNSIIAYAPPDKLAIIEQAIRAIDVPPDTGGSLQATLERMHIYHLSSMDPEPLVKTLQEIGNLDVHTRLEVDRRNRAIIAYATLADHVTIRALVEKLDGSGRRFEVIPLRRLEADYVAGTIQVMFLGGEEEKPKSSNRGYYSPFDFNPRPREDTSTSPDKFRVDADVVQNRLLLWANDLELEDVRKFLVKLGEIPPEGGNPDTVRVVEALGDKEADALLERIRNAWPRKNPLVVEPAEANKPAEKKEPDKSKDAPEQKPPAQTAPREKTAAAVPSLLDPPIAALRHLALGQAADRLPATNRAPVLLAQVGGDAPAAVAKPDVKPEAPTEVKADVKPEAPTDAKPAPPVRIARQADGRLVITSEDTAALDLLEDMIGEMAPSRQDYKIFRLKSAWAYGVASNLEDFFKQEDEEKSARSRYYDYWDYRPEPKTKERAGLSKRRPLKFISDSDTNTILVQGATPEQLRQIEELITFYDKPEPTDSQNIRKTATIPIRYSKARVIAEAVKEVYRDLLSSTDKAFAEKKDQQRPESRYTYIYPGDGEDKQTEQVPRFKGLLSMGVDEHSNTLIISAPACLFTQVTEMIQKLDEAAKPVGDVRVVKVGNGVSAERLQQALSGISQEGTSGARPPEGEPKTKTPPGPPAKPNAVATPAAE